MRNLTETPHFLLIRALPAILFVTIWQLGSNLDPRIAFFAGSPLSVAKVAIVDLKGTGLVSDVLLTGAESATGLVCALFVGLAASLVMYISRAAQASLSPYLAFAGSIPVFALAPLITLWLGVGITAKMFTAFATAVIHCTVHAAQGLSVVSRDYVRMAESLGATNYQLLRKVVIPGSLSALSVTSKSAASLALTGAFIGEFISSNRGLGHYTLRASQTYDAPRAVLGVILLSILGYILGKLSSFFIHAIVGRL